MSQKTPEQRTADRFLAGTIFVIALGTVIALSMSRLEPRYNFIIFVAGGMLAIYILLRSPRKKAAGKTDDGVKPPTP